MPGKTPKLNRSLCGLKQAGRIWNQQIENTLNSLGYHPFKTDACIYVRKFDTTNHYICSMLTIYLWLGLLWLKWNEFSGLEKKNGIKRFGSAEYVLGIQLIRKQNKSLKISQEDYLRRTLARFGMTDCKPATTPMTQSSTWICTSRTWYFFQNQIPPSNRISNVRISCNSSWPIYAVSYLSRFSSRPTLTHWTAIKHVFRYIKETLQLGLQYYCTTDQVIRFIGHSDSGWGACKDTSRSTMAFHLELAGAAISWSSKLQTRVAHSSTDAEYIALSHASKEAISLRQLQELGLPINTPTVLLGDNQGAVGLTKNPRYHQRTRHVRITEHCTRHG